MIPIRCISCNKVIAHLYQLYLDKINKENEHPKNVLDNLGIHKYCCRKTFITNIS